MNEKVIKFKELNNKLKNLISERIQLAVEYYKEKMPMFAKGNIIRYYNEIYIVDYVYVSHNDYIFRQRMNGNTIEYKYDNQIEKEYQYFVVCDLLITSGKSKKSYHRLYDFSYKHCEFICNVKDFERIAKENGFKAPKLNKQFVLKLYHKLKQNLVVSI
jgi:hypothetical protein